MRRLAALALFAAAIPAAASLVPWLGSDPGRCAMACHSGDADAGTTCCLLGGSPDRPVLQSCSGTRDGVPPAPGCRIFAPRPSASVTPLAPGGVWVTFEADRPIFRSVEPADPVPLRLS